MLVSDHDSIKTLDVFADGSEAPAQFPHAQAGIHQNTRIFGGQQGGIPGTAACQHAELNDTRLPLTL